MYCDKPHINQLTALLKEHGFQDIVVCPGSRNGILVHNFNTAHFRLHPVTDERSAAFVGLGISLSTRQPVAICVTSGSALLNTLPAVAEAYYRQIPLLVISADRPKQWINQLDGQTLTQNGALLPYAATYVLEEAKTEEEENWNILRMNEAILALQQNGGQPIHINVPITEPLFSFHTEKLPSVRVVKEEVVDVHRPLSEDIISRIRKAKFPILIMGQYEGGNIEDFSKIDDNGALLFLPEIISNQEGSWRTTALEHLLPDYDFSPDLVIHIGGNLVNKQLKLHLRKLPDCEVIRIEPTLHFPDTFCHLHTIIRTTILNAIHQIAQVKKENTFVRKYQKELDHYHAIEQNYAPCQFSDLGILQLVSQQLPSICSLQIGNSSVIRNAAYFFSEQNQHLFCNRGVNGIEGSLSTAVGYALGKQPSLTLSLIGDLSFFYDQNALWNKQLPNNLRIILFNNGGGQIFYRLPGLDQTEALSPYIAATHRTHAQGLASSYNILYLQAHSYAEVNEALPKLFQINSEKPILLEVFTKTEDNESELKKIKHYYKTRLDYGKNME